MTFKRPHFCVTNLEKLFDWLLNSCYLIASLNTDLPIRLTHLMMRNKSSSRLGLTVTDGGRVGPVNPPVIVQLRSYPCILFQEPIGGVKN